MSGNDAHHRRGLPLHAARRLSRDVLRISVLMTIAHARSAVGKSGVAIGHRRRLPAQCPERTGRRTRQDRNVGRAADAHGGVCRPQG